MFPWWLTLLACPAPTGVPEAADREAYLAAATGQGDCAAIEELSWAAECATFQAVELADAGRPSVAWAVCDDISDALWQQECAFAVVDALELTGAEAAEACARTGRFERDCASHALVRDLRLATDAHGEIGQEAALLAACEDMGTWYAATPGDRTGYLLFVHQLAQRLGARPFASTECGVASAEACRDLYLVALSSSPPQADLGPVCAERTTEVLAAAGVRPFLPGSEDTAASALEVFCSAFARGEDPRILGAVIDGAPSVPMGSYLVAPPPWRPPGDRHRGPAGQRPRRRGAR